MWRIATETRQRDKFGPGKDGFTRGNIATGLSSTQLEPDWFDNVQEEVSNVIEIELGPLDSFDRAQLWKAIDAQIDRKVAGIPAQPAFVLRAGDTMTGVLTITAGLAPPIAGVSTGTRLVLFPGGGSTADIALGIMAGGLWFSVRTPGDFFAWYTGPTEIANLTAAGFAVTPAPTNRAHLANKGYVDDLFATFGGYLPLTGGTITGGLNVNGLLNAITSLACDTFTVRGAGIVYSRYSGNVIGFGWDSANVNSYVDGQYQGRIVIANPSAVIGGNLEVGGNGNFASLGCFGGATIVGAASAAHLISTGGCDVTGTSNTGWVNSSGDFAITGGGAFSSNAGQIDICQTGTRANVGKIRLAANFVESGGTHDVYGDIRITNNGWKPGGGEWAPGNPLLTRDDAIEPYERGLKAIRELAPMIYGEQRFVGLALEDCRAVLPEMVLAVASQVGDAAGVTHGVSVDMSALKYALVNAVKELAERVEALERAWPAPAPA